MRKSRFFLALAMSAAVSAPAVAQLDVEDQIETRQSAFTFAAWNMGKIKAQAVDGAVAYNEQQMLSAANAIASVANSGLSALFGPGTALDENDDTRLKPEFFDKPDRAREVAINFAQQASKLQEIAANGADKAAIAAQFSEVGKSCKACHDDFRAE
ncbi:c-type cytochrome [Marinobacter piscensis]|uniref:c-type cytochrome n=1 Tax=Marinobacter piscensis TaxID=1562308 RepID=UPI0011A847E1|nr:cytochrome c [Marinobacter piscensis]